VCAIALPDRKQTNKHGRRSVADEGEASNDVNDLVDTTSLDLADRWRQFAISRDRQLDGQRASCNAVGGDGGTQVTVEVIVLTVSVATLARREDLLAAVDVAAVHLARMNLLQVLLQHEVVAEALLTDVTRDTAVRVGGRTLVAAAQTGRVRVVDGRRVVHLVLVVIRRVAVVVMMYGLLVVGPHARR